MYVSSGLFGWGGRGKEGRGRERMMSPFASGKVVEGEYLPLDIRCYGLEGTWAHGLRRRACKCVIYIFQSP